MLVNKARYKPLKYIKQLRVQSTKLPHEFEKGEEVLIRHHLNSPWKRYSFYSCTKVRYIFEKDSTFVYVCEDEDEVVYYKYCIPYKGNKHLKDKVTKCKSGAIPNNYVFPPIEYKFNPFDKVLVRNNETDEWTTSLFSYIDTRNENKYQCSGVFWKYCMPYNDNTESFLGVTLSPDATFEDWED